MKWFLCSLSPHCEVLTRKSKARGYMNRPQASNETVLATTTLQWNCACFLSWCSLIINTINRIYQLITKFYNQSWAICIKHSVKSFKKQQGIFPSHQQGHQCSKGLEKQSQMDDPFSMGYIHIRWEKGCSVVNEWCFPCTVKGSQSAQHDPILAFIPTVA